MANAIQDSCSCKENNQPVVYPLKRLLYSRKVMIGALAFVVSILGYYGLPEVIVNTFNAMALAMITSWTAKDVSANFGNNRTNK